MISRFSQRLPLRLQQDTAHIQTIPSAIRHASTTAPPQPVPSEKPMRKRTVRITTPVERAYKLRLASGKKYRPIQIDSYTQKLIDARTEAIKLRQRAAREAKEEKVFDSPIHGRATPTPFVQSLELGMPADKVYIPDEDGIPSRTPAVVDTKLKDHEQILSSDNTGVATPHHLAHFISSEELQRFWKLSSALSAPVPNPIRAVADPEVEKRKKIQHEEDHATRMAALARILAIENQGSLQRHRVNKRRIIDEFGRHKTDQTIDPRQNIRQPYHDAEWQPKQRIGPDTGSSEVQIGLLTAQIKLVAKEFEGRNKNDKQNKRNLRLLLHRRQKLLAYFYKRDKGGERWQHMVEKLGITPAMWKGEIEVR